MGMYTVLPSAAAAAPLDAAATTGEAMGFVCCCWWSCGVLLGAEGVNVCSLLPARPQAGGPANACRTAVLPRLLPTTACCNALDFCRVCIFFVFVVPAAGSTKRSSCWLPQSTSAHKATFQCYVKGAVGHTAVTFDVTMSTQSTRLPRLSNANTSTTALVASFKHAFHSVWGLFELCYCYAQLT